MKTKVALFVLLFSAIASAQNVLIRCLPAGPLGPFETVCTAPDGITVTYKSPLMYSVTHFTEQQWAREVRIRSLRLELRSLIEMRAFASTRLTPEQAKFYWQVISRPRYDEGTPVWKVMQKRWPELEELCPNWHRTGEACTDEDWEFGIRAWGPYGDPLGAKP